MRIRKINCATTFILCILTAILGIISGINFNVSAEETGSATLICKSDDETLAEMTWRIYYAGSRDGNQFILGGAFSEYAVTFGDVSAEALTAAASTLESYAVLDNISPDGEGKTDSEGKIEFKNLKTGLYLVSGDKLQIDNATYLPAPMLIEVSENNPDFTAYPKFAYYDVLGSGFEHMTVKKIWENDEQSLQDRAVSIDIEIYCNEELKETVTLNEENDWTYSWNAQLGDVWRVMEITIPDNYTVTYRSNQTQFVIVNTHKTLTPTTSITTSTTTASITTSSIITSSTKTDTNTSISKTTAVSKPTSVSTSRTESKLPQTGQLWWPVPILALGGVIFVGIGCCLISRSKKEDDQ